MENSAAVASILIPALSAVLGAILGTYLALFQKTRESAFERRLAWYEGMYKALMIGRARISDEVRKLERGSDDPESLSKVIVQGLHDVREMRLTAALYATEDILKKLDEVFDGSQNLLRSATERMPLASSEYVRLAKLLTNFELTAAKLIADEIRQHLGLGSLQRYWALTSRRSEATRSTLADRVEAQR